MAREKFTIRLNEDEKQRYTKHYQEHTDFDSLSRWLRELANNAVDAPAEDTLLDEALLGKVITDTIEPLRDDLNHLNEQLSELDEAVRTGDDITHLAEDIYTILGTEKPENFYKYPRDIPDKPECAQIEHYLGSMGDAYHFSQYLGISEEEARRALVRAENMFPRVKTDLNDVGKRYWYRTDASIGQEWRSEEQ